MKEFFESELFEDIKRFFDLIAERFKNIKEPGRPFIIKAFLAIIILLTALSAAMIILDSSEDNGAETTLPTTDVSSVSLNETTPQQENGQLKSNILFALDNEEAEVHLLFVMSLDSEKEETKIFFLEPTAVCKVNEIEGSLIYHLENGGASQLVLAVSEYMDVEIDRYLVGDEKSFVSIVRHMGDIEIDVKESISYTHNGLSYIIDEGVQVMTPDMLLKYVVYLCDDTEKYGETLKNIFALFGKALFDCDSSQQAQDCFGEIIGYFETNISALDFSRNKNAVMKLARELTLKLEAYNSLAEFKGYEPEEKQ